MLPTEDVIADVQLMSQLTKVRYHNHTLSLLLIVA